VCDAWPLSSNVELVRSITAAWERGEYDSLEWAHPEIEFVIEDLPASGSSQGVAGMRQAWIDFQDVWDEHRVETDEFRELDEERVLVLCHFIARGRTSGMDIEQLRTTGANVFYLREGMVVKLVIYFDRRHALADLGLG
jgi:hypothetical protein